MLYRTLVRTVASVAAATAIAVSAQAETPVGSNVDSRVLVGMQVNPEGMQALMPEGWDSISWPGGPLKGSNLLIGLIDGILEMDTEGKFKAPPGDNQ